MGQYKPIQPVPGKTTMHQRSRVVITQPTEEDAMELAERISETCACDVESFFSIVDDAADENRGEIVFARKFYPCKGAMVPAETQGA